MAAEAKPAGNGFKSELLKSFITRVEQVEADIASVMGAAMREAKSLREDIKEQLALAKDEGIPIKALKAELRLRKLDRAKAKVVAGLDGEDAETLEMVREALGDLASSPLGEAALKAAQQAVPT